MFSSSSDSLDSCSLLSFVSVKDSIQISSSSSSSSLPSSSSSSSSSSLQPTSIMQRRAFSVVCPSAWNNLPLELHSLPLAYTSISLKSFYFDCDWELL